MFVFAAKKGVPIAFEVEADELGFLLDGALTITDSAGEVLAEADDVRKNRDPQINFTAPADAEYRLTIRDVHAHGGPRYVYRLTAVESKPGFELTLSADTFEVKRGATVEVAVSIERTNGFQQEIEISAGDLPSGITMTPVKSLAKGDTAKNVKLVLQAAADAHSGVFQVLGKTGEGMPLERRAGLSIHGMPRTFSQAWITAVAAGK